MHPLVWFRLVQVVSHGGRYGNWWNNIVNLHDMVGYIRDHCAMDDATALANVTEMLEKPWHWDEEYRHMRAIGYPEES